MQSDFDHLMNEHIALGRQYGMAQERCSRQLQAQQLEIKRLQSETMILRAAIIQRDTALACARQDQPALEASLIAADLVICQTGCLSHGDYWRVQDHCKRTGKACVVTAEPDALRIVHIHAQADGHAMTLQKT
jgi:hypothetical protein